LPTRSLP